MALTVHRVPDIAAKVSASVALVPMATLGHLAVHVYVVQGQVDWHRHPDEDELFLVHEGMLTLETELGNAILHAEELAVVPKGVGHRSSSPLRTVSLLIRPEVMSPRTNGRRRVAVTESDPRLEKVRLSRLRPLLAVPYHPVPVARVDGFALALDLAHGESPEARAPRGGWMAFCLRGNLEVRAEGERATLSDGHLIVLPTDTTYRLSADLPAVYLSVASSQ